jgi:hypothetical protein
MKPPCISITEKVKFIYIIEIKNTYAAIEWLYGKKNSSIREVTKIKHKICDSFCLHRTLQMLILKGLNNC